MRRHRCRTEHRNSSCVEDSGRLRQDCCLLSRGHRRSPLRLAVIGSSQPESASQILLPGPRPQTCLIGNWSSLTRMDRTVAGCRTRRRRALHAGHVRWSHRNPALAYGPGCRGIGTSTIPATAYGSVRQQGMHAHCQTFGKDPVKHQRLSLLVRVDQSAQELVVRGRGDCQRETVWPLAPGRRRMAVECRALGDKSGRSPQPGLLATMAMRRRAAGRPQPLPSPRSPQGESGEPASSADDERSPICGQSLPTTQNPRARSSDCVILDKRWR